MPLRHRYSQPVELGVLAGLLFLTLAVGRFGAAVTQPALDTWYRDLPKPAWTPPDLAFPVVWTALYVAMAVAAWLAWRAATHEHRRWGGAATLFVLQLALNAAWSYLFFGLKSPPLALVDAGLLLAAVAATIAAFARLSRAAAWLLVPYPVWVVYAVALNAAIVAKGG